MTAVFQYFLSITGVGLLGAIIRALLPEGMSARVGRLACSLLMLLVAITPVLRLDSEQIMSWILKMEIAKESAMTGISVKTKDLTAELISEKLGAYVLDKAESIGAQIEVEVSMDQEGSYPVPKEVRITGTLTGIQQALLREYLEEQFSIPADRQVFIP